MRLTRLNYSDTRGAVNRNTASEVPVGRPPATLDFPFSCVSLYSRQEADRLSRANPVSGYRQGKSAVFPTVCSGQLKETYRYCSFLSLFFKSRVVVSIGASPRLLEGSRAHPSYLALGYLPYLKETGTSHSMKVSCSFCRRH